MFIRTTRFQVKKGSMGKFNELAEYAKSRAASLDGLLSNYLAVDPSGKGVMIGVWESKEKSAGNQSAIASNWAGVKEHLEGEPVVDEYSTVAQVKG